MNIDNAIQAAEHLTGFVIVMIALGVLWGFTTLVGRIFIRNGEAAPKPATAPSPAAAEVATEDEDDLAVVAAAAAVMLDSAHRVVSVRPLPSSWGQQGRRDIHASHRIR